jgi:hypothetical protein
VIGKPSLGHGDRCAQQNGGETHGLFEHEVEPPRGIFAFSGRQDCGIRTPSNQGRLLIVVRSLMFRAHLGAARIEIVTITEQLES